MKKKTIKIKTDKKTQEQYLDIKQFSDFVDITKIQYYEMKEVTLDDGTKGISLMFYDKEKKVIKAN